MGSKTKTSISVIAGGETVGHFHGNGLGGRNQELALSAARWLKNALETAIFSIGSVGTDGPTDVAGEYIDGATVSKLLEAA